MIQTRIQEQPKCISLYEVILANKKALNLLDSRLYVAY